MIAMDAPPPPNPRAAGLASLVVAIVALIAAASVLPSSLHSASSVKKALIVAGPLALVALFLAIVGRSTHTGRIGGGIALLVLLSVAATVVLVSFR